MNRLTIQTKKQTDSKETACFQFTFIDAIHQKGVFSENLIGF